MKKRKKQFLVFAGAILLVWLLRSFLFTTYVIPSSGMENSLLQGDRILVNKWSYGLRTPFSSLFSYHRWCYKNVQSGEIVVFNNPASDKEEISRREVFIGRCVGTPGDTLRIDSLLVIQTQPKVSGPDRKSLYSYPIEREATMDSLLTALAITENELLGSNDSCHARSFSHYEYYLLEQALGSNNWIRPAIGETGEEIRTFVIPRRGETVAIRPWNLTLMLNTILLHEQRNAYAKEGQLYVDGQPVTSFTFSKDYYWMASNNVINLNDSRLFGLVPHDHLIGKASIVWFSKEAYSGFGRGYRWNRFFTRVK
ncbi:signal peptidase I [Bacteroides sp. OttesenSCG-928-F21]|nr:signal peptidase I [Bacteroides sp. OttesenSCG-928-F21]